MQAFLRIINPPLPLPLLNHIYFYLKSFQAEHFRLESCFHLFCPEIFCAQNDLDPKKLYVKILFLKTKFLVKKCLSPILWSKKIRSKTFLIG